MAVTERILFHMEDFSLEDIFSGLEIASADAALRMRSRRAEGGAISEGLKASSRADCISITLSCKLGSSASISSNSIASAGLRLPKT